MTDKLVDNFGEKDPRVLWEEMRQTKFSDDQIREMIWGAMDCPVEYASGNALTAQAMIAYNEMIDARIERAQRSWGMK